MLSLPGKKIYSIILCFILSASLEGQNLVYKNYTTEEGLPSSEVYYCIQDNVGYIWFATDRGVCQYNGYEFKTYTTYDGLTDNVIFKVIKGPQKKLWFLTYKGGLCYFKDGKIYSHPINDIIIKKFYKDNNYISSLFVDDSDTIWLSTTFNQNGYQIFKISPDNKIINVNPLENSNSSYNYAFVKIFKGERVFSYRNQYLNKSSINNEIVSFYINGFYIFKNFLSDGQSNSLVYNDVLITTNNNGIHIQNMNNLNDYKIIKTSLRINSIIKDHRNRILLSTDKGLGIFNNYKDLFNIDESLFFLKNCYITSASFDHEKNLWLTTYNNGVYKIDNIDIINITENYNKNFSIDFVHKVKESIYFSTSSLELYNIKGLRCDKKASFNRKINKSSNNIVQMNLSAAVELDDEKLLLSNFFIFNSRYDKLYKLKYLTRYALSEFFYIKKLYKINHDTLLVGLSSGLGIIENDRVLFDSKNINFRKKVNALLPLNKTEYLVATTSGLYKFNYLTRRIQLFDNTHFFFRKNITDIKIERNILFFSTSDSGFYLFDLSYKRYKRVDNYKYNKLHYVNKLFIENNNIWCATNSGMYIFSYNSNLNILPKNKYDITDGLPSNTTKDIVKLGLHFYICSQNDIFRFIPEDIYIISAPPPLIIDSVKVNNNIVNYCIDTIYDYNENNFTFYYTGIFYRSGVEKNYKYQLLKDGTEYIYATVTHSRDIKMLNLPHGDYILSIVAINKDGIIGNYYKYHFVIKRHFTQKLWFVLLITLALFTFVFFIVMFIIRNYKIRAYREKMILISEHKALRAQMNPHFIFNSLNSIQFYITENNVKEASNYLSKFSKLVRNTLYFSSYNFISLLDEIDNIKLYVEIEKLRFGKYLDYFIKTSLGSEPKAILIPSMIVQPFIENSILHGIIPKKGQGKVGILFEEKNNTLICSITDNGIGRKTSKKLKEKRSRNHKSTGLKNIEERIKLLNATFNTNINITIIDNYDDLGNPSGTTVTITMPLLKDDKAPGL